MKVVQALERDELSLDGYSWNVTRLLTAPAMRTSLVTMSKTVKFR